MSYQRSPLTEKDDWDGPEIYKLQSVANPEKYLDVAGDEVIVRCVNLMSQTCGRSTVTDGLAMRKPNKTPKNGRSHMLARKRLLRPTIMITCGSFS